MELEIRYMIPYACDINKGKLIERAIIYINITQIHFRTKVQLTLCLLCAYEHIKFLYANFLSHVLTRYDLEFVCQ